MYGMDLAAAKKASSLHITTKCVTNSYTYIGETSLLPMYAANPSSTSSEADQRGGYIKGVKYWRQELAYLSGYYDNGILMP